MIRTRLAAIAAGIVLVFTGAAAANASTQVAHPSIYMSNNGHNPGTLTVTCDNNALTVHTILWADLANIDQTVKVYREDTNALVFGPVAIPAGGHVPAAFPFVPGIAYDAIAVPTVDPWPTTTADLIARLSAKPPTADNSQLLPSMMPTPPTGCVPPPPNPCEIKPVLDAVVVVQTCPPCPKPEVKDAAIAVVVPTCVPETSEPSHKPTTSKPPTSSSSSSATSSATTSVSTPVSSSLGVTTSQATPTPTGSATPTPTSPALAHTGASVAPFAVGALVLLAGGGAFVVYARRARRH
jgi:hypothetical protein